MIFLLTQILHSSRSNHPRIAYKWSRMLLRGYSPPGPLKCSTWHQFCFPYAGSPKFWWSLLDASIYQWTTTTTHLRSVDQCSLTLPQSKLKTKGDCAFKVVGPKLWTLFALDTVDIFKKKLKTNLCRHAFI